jgi:hypothetical protein
MDARGLGVTLRSLEEIVPTAQLVNEPMVVDVLGRCVARKPLRFESIGCTHATP